MAKLTHFDDRGRSRMVDVGEKQITTRTARASGKVGMLAETLALIRDRNMAKGDVLEVARLAGIMAAKRTSDLIPLCHPIALDNVSVELACNVQDSCVDIEATARISARTGVEMEALTAVTVAGLTIYDMCKAVDRAMRISEVRLTHKAGGKSGTYDAD